LLCAGLLTLACASGAPDPVRACLTLEGSENLNLYDGQAHAVTLYLYPLTSKLGFQEASIQDLLEGHQPPGAAGPPVPITIGPGELREFDEPLPPSAAFVGIVADYYRGPGDPEGERRIVVPAKCSLMRTKRIALLPQELAEGN
jgi:type VI secretion system VasD/TssJ family lipoprotein